MKTLYALILSFTLLSGCASAMTLPEQSTLAGQTVGGCPDGSTMGIEFYKPTAEEEYVLVFYRGTKMVGTFDTKTKMIYVIGSKETYNLDDPKNPYPSPCDIPVPQGT